MAPCRVFPVRQLVGFCVAALGRAVSVAYTVRRYICMYGYEQNTCCILPILKNSDMLRLYRLYTIYL